MVNQSKNFISFVALGGQNPQIINVDFLKDEKIIPIDESPFDQIFSQEKPVKKFISLPGLANLVIGNLEFTIDEGRFQIREKEVSEWTDTKIIDIAKRYFEVLKYTPLKMIGFNFNSTIVFDTPEEAEKCQNICLPKDSPLVKIISKDYINISASSILRYPYGDNDGHILLTIEQPNKENTKRIINFNYEFDFTDWTIFKRELEKFSEIANYSDSILEGLIKLL